MSNSYRLLLASAAPTRMPAYHRHGTSFVHRRRGAVSLVVTRASSSSKISSTMATTLMRQQQQKISIMMMRGASSSLSASTGTSGSISSCSNNLTPSSSFSSFETAPSFLATTMGAFVAATTAAVAATATSLATTEETSHTLSSPSNSNTVRNNSSHHEIGSRSLFYGEAITKTTTSCESSSSNSVNNSNFQTNKQLNDQRQAIILASSPPPSSVTTIGLADETDDTVNDTPPDSILLNDGMDASVGSDNYENDEYENGGKSTSEGGGLADAAEDDDDDDPSMDEETTCSICLINRRGPCRKYWLKFEKCMKEHHSAEKKEEEENERMEGKRIKVDRSNGEDDNDGNNGDGDEGMASSSSSSSLEEGWDAFMEKSTRPGEEDEEDEDEESDDDEEEEEEDGDDDDEEKKDATTTASTTGDETKSSSSSTTTTTSLAERCDRHMIPWIECIQRHRNTYSLISNEFYQGDYIDPLEYSIPEERRELFGKLAGTDLVDKKQDAEVGINIDNNDDGGVNSGNGGYVVKFDGVEIDLESWKEHIDAESDNYDDDDDNCSSSTTTTTIAKNDNEEGPHLINASAKFHLTNPSVKKSPSGKYDSGGQIEVAYIKDQRGRLLGFDSFSSTKKEKDVEDNDSNNIAVGECTFHIVPGETTSIVAYAIYRGTTTTTPAKYGDGDGASTILREDFLYHTPNIPLPGVSTK